MHQLLAGAALFVALFFLPHQAAATADTTPQDITLTLPESVIANAAKAVLPIKLDARSETIEGDITIINISELALTDGHLACRLHLAGSNLALVTEIAGHEIKLKVGEIELQFSTIAEIRFDTAKQELYIKPIVKDVDSKSSGAKGDIGQALVALLNGREFPIKIDKLDPLIAETGTKTITINSTIADIAARKDILQLRLTPEVTAQ